MKSSYFSDIFISYFCPSVGFALWGKFWMTPIPSFVPARPPAHSSLKVLIKVVVGASPKKQMGWVYARRVVAMMTYAQTIWNGPKANHPANAVRQKTNLGHLKHSVSFMDSTSPQPALIASHLVNPPPKPLLVFISKMRDALRRLIHGDSCFGFRVLSRV